MKWFYMSMEKRNPASQNKGGFSLIELLVVMGIMGVVVSFAVLPLAQVGRTQSLANAGNQVVDLAGLARQNSLSKNAITALLFSDRQGISASQALVAVYELMVKEDGTDPEASDWRQITPWTPLPSGTVIDVFSGMEDQNVQPVPHFPSLQCQGTVMEGYRYLLFLPGAKLQDGTNASLRVVEGQLDSNARVVYSHPRVGSAGPSNYYQIHFVGATAMAKIERP